MAPPPSLRTCFPARVLSTHSGYGRAYTQRECIIATVQRLDLLPFPLDAPTHLQISRHSVTACTSHSRNCDTKPSISNNPSHPIPSHLPKHGTDIPTDLARILAQYISPVPATCHAGPQVDVYDPNALPNMVPPPSSPYLFSRTFRVRSTLPNVNVDAAARHLNHSPFPLGVRIPSPRRTLPLQIWRNPSACRPPHLAFCRRHAMRIQPNCTTRSILSTSTHTSLAPRRLTRHLGFTQASESEQVSGV